MKPRVYIDGKEGTTGLQIYDRLAARSDIDLLLIDGDRRKDPIERKKLMDAADIVFLCLPDAAAIEAVGLIESPTTRVIDASTAHRTAAGWDYGFPELSLTHRANIRESRRVANPGCHATGFISCVYPLVAMGVLPRDYPLTCCSLTGYSGGGKKMIAQYEAPDKGEALYSPRIYGLNLQHKHLPEMQKICGLTRPPVFCPIVDDYYKGMATTISLHNDLLVCDKSARAVWETLADYYQDQTLVKVAPFGWSEPMIAANTMAGKDSLTLIVNGNETHTTVTALFDNLGKGASGAAVQNMNLMLGLPETEGLAI
ncbi:MAG: N-acetyl-gamma-glutamyl-phosphate reductase [Oscillospiraceae bacterium]|nr:N-acetyl-gamma-glutamyl-phosphate reductase [Oscillospiraceae bacterium]